MPPSLHFRSYCSNSAGNCLALWTDKTCVLFDCGIATLRDCRNLLCQQQARHVPVAALVVSHVHRDHLSAQALRVLSEEAIPVRCHRKTLPQLRARHGFDVGPESPVRAFGLLPHLRTADLVFIEANHDLELLRKRFNYASQWHSSNAKTASLLADAIGRAGHAPRNVILGHLSEERNEDRLPLQAVRQAFAKRGMKLEFELETAPKYDASRVIRID